MPADLKSDSPDAIAYRDLPQAEPRDHELTEIAADVWAQIKRDAGITTSDLIGRLAQARIKMALIEVRQAAASNAACKAYNRAIELVR